MATARNKGLAHTFVFTKLYVIIYRNVKRITFNVMIKKKNAASLPRHF